MCYKNNKERYWQRREIILNTTMRYIQNIVAHYKKQGENVWHANYDTPVTKSVYCLKG